MSTISGRNRFNCLLKIEAPHWTSLLRVHNHLFQEVGRTCGPVSFELPQGVYEVEATLGLEKQSQLIAVRPGRPAFISADSWTLRYRSAAPLRATSTSLTAHEEGARRWSRTLTRERDSDAESRLFVFLRALSPESSLLGDKGLRLLRGSGELLSDFSSDVYVDYKSNYLALTCDLPPGPYMLHTKEPIRYQPLWLSPGYETQVFIPFAEMVALDERSVFMVPRGEGFDPDNENIISAELIWQRLQRKDEPLLMGDDVQYRMLQAAIANPWVCILLTHAMHDLAQSSTDEILEFIPSNDEKVLGLLQSLRLSHPGLRDHPDARALTLSGGEPAGKVFDFPPMLWRSLKLVQRHAASYFGTIPPGSLTDRVLDSLVLDSGWSAWRNIDYQTPSERDEESYRRLLEEADNNPDARPLYLVRQKAHEDSTLMRLARSRSFNEEPPEVLLLPEDDFSKELRDIESIEVSRECGITLDRAQAAISFLQKHPVLLMQPEILSPSTQAAAFYVRHIHERGTDSPDEQSSNSFSLEEAERRLRRAAVEFIRLSTLSEQLARGFPVDSETMEFFKAIFKEFPGMIYRKWLGRGVSDALIEQFETLFAQGETIKDYDLRNNWLRLIGRQWGWSLTDAANIVALADTAILITDTDGSLRAANSALRYILSREAIAEDEFAERLSQSPSPESILRFYSLPPWFWISRRVAVKRANQDEALAYLYLLRSDFYRPIDREGLRQLDQLTSGIALHQALFEYGTPQQRPAYLQALWQYMGQLSSYLQLP